MVRFAVVASIVALAIALPVAASAECGNGLLEAPEECDDGNLLDGDCCSSTCENVLSCDDGISCTHDFCDPATVSCVSLPEPNSTYSGTYYLAKSTFKLREHPSSDARDRLTLRADVNQGPAPNLSDLSDGFSLCVWDFVADTPSLVMQIDVPGGAGWREGTKRDGRRTFRYDDATGANGGIDRVRFVEHGDAGPSYSNRNLLIRARGLNLELPGPVSADAYFSQDSAVMVEFETSSGVWSSYIRPDETRRNTSRGFLGR